MKNDKKFSCLVALIFLSIFIKSFLLHPTFSDENFYFNVAKNVAEGKVPYKDFFFAHPPLQIYALATIYKIFGISFVIGKLFTLIFSSACILLLYLIAKELSDKTSAFFVSVLFLISPPWIAFSSISYGMWECMAFLLLSFLLLLKRKFSLSAIFFSVAFLFKYIAVLYFPIFLFILYMREKKILPLLLSYPIIFSLVVIPSFIIFGKEYIYQTIFYHLLKVPFQSKVQYFSMGIFFIFLALISVLMGILKGDKLTLFLAIFPFFIDILLLLGLKIVFYHYFLLSIPFYLLAFSRVLKFKYFSIIFTTLVLLSISFIFNFQTFDFYLNSIHSQKFYNTANSIEKNIAKNESIFGEPVMTNYISFVTGRKIAGNYLDSYIQHLKVEGVENIVKILEDKKPKVFIEMEGYYSSLPELYVFIDKNYNLINIVKNTPTYLIYKLKD